MGREPPVPPDGESRMIAIDLFAGAVAGVACDSVMHPVDTIKARLQAQRGNQLRYSGMFDCFRKVMKEEGARRGLYAGFAAVLLGTTATHGLMFATFKGIKRRMETGVDDNGLAMVDLISGSIGEIAALVPYVPAEVVAKRMQVASLGPARNYRSPIHALKVIYRTEGMRGIYAGGASTALRDIPYTALQFALFETSKDAMRRWQGREKVTSGEAIGLGFFVGVVAATLTNPFDVVKTRMQTQPSGCDKKYFNVRHCFRRIVAEEGWSALVKGLVPRIAWVAPGSAITFGVFETVRAYFYDRMQVESIPS